SKFKGAYQHFYDDNFSEYQLMTHYVFLTYKITFNGELSSLPVE
ncbi:MAG: colanic acid biosynthesis protein WcaH, partial [Psychromonas sp.]